MSWEFAFLHFLQELHTPWLDQIMTAVTSLANHGEVWVLLALVFCCVPKTRRMGFAMALSIAVGYVAGNLVLKNLIARSRPCWVRPEVPVLVPVPRDYSFPSGHTLVSFEGAVCIWRFERKWGWAALGLALLIAFSRMYLFVHFPTDILGGMVLGTANGYVAAGYLRERGIRQNGKEKKS